VGVRRDGLNGTSAPRWRTEATAAAARAVDVICARLARLFLDAPVEDAAAAQGLFSALRALDASGADLIWVETPPAHSAWDGVRDRLQRAAAA
jgi:hypothetical protein